MKYLKIVCIAATAAIAMTALITGSASATTLEVNGVEQTGAVTVSASLESGSSSVDSNTAGTFVNTCTGSTFHGSTSVFTGASVTWPLSSLTFSGCTPYLRVADKAGTLSITHIAGTTNGTVISSGAEITISSPFGSITCKSNSTHLGTLTGATTISNPGPHAILDVNAILNCGIVPSWKWTATYVITTPTGLGVVA